MPTREEIVDQINKAADIFEMIGIEFLGKQALKNYSDKMRKSAAQVAAMRCETCKHRCYTSSCSNFNQHILGLEEGCFSHEPKV